jgi:hypothetical protein
MCKQKLCNIYCREIISRNGFLANFINIQNAWTPLAKKGTEYGRRQHPVCYLAHHESHPGHSLAIDAKLLETQLSSTESVDWDANIRVVPVRSWPAPVRRWSRLWLWASGWARKGFAIHRLSRQSHTRNTRCDFRSGVMARPCMIMTSVPEIAQAADTTSAWAALGR